MKFSVAILATLVAVAAAQSSSGTAPKASASATPSRVPTALEKCIAACDPADVTCQAHCNNVPAPNESMVNANTECAAKCDQGKGTPEDTEKYAACQSKCRSSHFMPSETAGAGSAAKTSGSSDSGSATNSGSASDNSADSTGGATKPSGTGSSSTQSAPASSSSNNNNSAGTLTVSAGAGLLAMIAAVIAL
jgi:cobalamin biosynthesis Mg chelatase CobN